MHNSDEDYHKHRELVSMLMDACSTYRNAQGYGDCIPNFTRLAYEVDTVVRCLREPLSPTYLACVQCALFGFAALGTEAVVYGIIGAPVAYNGHLALRECLQTSKYQSEMALRDSLLQVLLHEYKRVNGTDHPLYK